MVITNQIGTTMSRDNTHDIVTRLREGKGDDIVLFGMMYEAADEIEHLRRTIKVLEYTLEANEDAQNES